MAKKLETAANVVVIVVGLLVAVVLVRQYWFPRSAETIRVGERLPALSGIDWGAHPKTLLLALQEGCHFCEDSMPFYKHLDSIRIARGSDCGIVAVFPNDPQSASEVLQSNGLRLQAVGGIALSQLSVSGTPTLILVSQNGTVLKSWAGELTAAQESEVIASVTKN